MSETVGLGYAIAKALVCVEIVAKQSEDADFRDELLECRQVIKEKWHDILIKSLD